MRATKAKALRRAMGFKPSAPREFSHDRMIEKTSIGQKFEWLLSQPIRKFSRFGASLVADCWCEIEGHIDLITRLPDGKLKCLHDLFYSMQEGRC